MPTISPGAYESAILEHLVRDFAPLGHRVAGTEAGSKLYVRGRYSGAKRQLDAAVFRSGEDIPFLIGEAHRHGRRLHVKNVEAFLGMMDDVGAKMGIIFCPSGYSPAALRRAHSASLSCTVVSVEKAYNLNLLNEARRIFPLDWAFHQHMAEALKSLRDGGDSASFAEALENVPYDEWERLARYALDRHRLEAEIALRAVASDHLDDGWRYNAVLALDEFGLLSVPELLSFAAGETNAENQELLFDTVLDRSRESIIAWVKTHDNVALRYRLIDYLGQKGRVSVEEITKISAAQQNPEILALLQRLCNE